MLKSVNALTQNPRTNLRGVGSNAFENDGQMQRVSDSLVSNPSSVNRNPYFTKIPYAGHTAPISKGIPEEHFRITHYATGY